MFGGRGIDGAWGAFDGVRSTLDGNWEGSGKRDREFGWGGLEKDRAGSEGLLEGRFGWGLKRDYVGGMAEGNLDRVREGIGLGNKPWGGLEGSGKGLNKGGGGGLR